ncbi:MAG: hypothetical protein AAGF50_08565 [Pseudomonadota bacterium]
MSWLAKLRKFSTGDEGAVAIDVVLIVAVAVGLGAAGFGVMTVAAPDHTSSAYSENPDAAQPTQIRVCTPNGGQCAIDHDGDGMVDELRNNSRGKALDVEGNGLTIQGYTDSGWS